MAETTGKCRQLAIENKTAIRTWNTYHQVHQSLLS
jgi:hypothetical protein